MNLVRLVREIISVFSPRVVVVNDGSDEKCAHIFEALKSMGCDVLAHSDNRGKGAALKTGIGRALSTYPDACGIVTADADGQHSPRDIHRLAECLNEGAAGIALGARRLDNKQAPLKSRLGNKITSVVFRLKTGIKLSDTQTGLRAIPMRYAPLVLKVRGSRFEYETNMLLFASRMNIPLVTTPIETIYSDDNRSSHFRAVRDSARIYFDIFKFGCSSVICAAVDFGLFVLFSSLVFGRDNSGIIISVVSARIISGACNFLINRFIVFRGKGQKAPVKYFLLFLAQMLLSAKLTALLAQGPLMAPAAKLIVDAFLFVLSFIIQRKFIFKREGNGDAA